MTVKYTYLLKQADGIFYMKYHFDRVDMLDELKLNIEFSK